MQLLLIICVVFGLAGTAVALLGELIKPALFGDFTNRAALGAAVFFLFLHIGL